jgi:hypothetical protein
MSDSVRAQFEVLDERFRYCRGDAWLEQLHTGCRWTTGRIWAAAADGLHCFDPDGTLIGKLRVPEIVANFTFGGAKRNHLFICATSSLYSILVSVNGARYPR